MDRVLFRWIIATVACFCVFPIVEGEDISIRLFASVKPEVVVFTARSGDYIMLIPGHDNILLKQDAPVLIFNYLGRVGVKIEGVHGMITDSVMLRSSIRPDGNAIFSLSRPGSGSALRYYNDDLLCRNDSGIFLILNITTIEKYLPGVVVAEGGSGREPGFYKAQSVLARTYAWQNLEKHATDRYNLCDDVHCQAYHGRYDGVEVAEAVLSTSRLVMTGRDSVLVMAAFHSNCGGETVASANAWVSDQPHLKSIIDPHCTGSRNALWQKTVPAAEWLRVLAETGYHGTNTDLSELYFIQTNRHPFYETTDGFKIPVNAIRSILGLRSTFFSFRTMGDSLLFDGRGYGHGVGLCQEGAMVMAEKGHTFREIISFYYKDVILLDISDAKFPPRINQ